MLSFNSRKTMILYVFMGIAHSLLTMYVSIPISYFFSLPYTWNRNAWTVIIIICTIVVSLIEKKIYIKKKYIWLLLTAILALFATSFCCAIIVFIFTPSIMF